MSQRKRHTPEAKAKAVLETLKEMKTLSELASCHGVHSTQLVRWKNLAIQELPKIFIDPRSRKDSEKDELIEELYRRIGLLSTQVEWLKKKSGLNPE
jgi:putative transposase